MPARTALVVIAADGATLHDRLSLRDRRRADRRVHGGAHGRPGGGRFTADHLAELAPGAPRVGFEAAEPDAWPRHAVLAETATLELVPTPGIVERLREVKDAEELEAVRRSAALIAPVYETLAAEGLEGRRELDVAWRVRELFHEQGAEGLSFDTIVASHERGAMPHAEPSEAAIGSGTLVTIDLGCILDGYCSDCTRTFATGDAGR